MVCVEARDFFFLASLLSATALAMAGPQSSVACYGSVDAGNCKEHRLRCQQHEKLFPLQARRGLKHVRVPCSAPIANCSTLFDKCCALSKNDCLIDYTDDEFAYLVDGGGCWNGQQCTYPVPRGYYFDSPCGDSFPKYSTYSAIDYACIPESRVRSFKKDLTVTGTNMALTYSSKSTSREVKTVCRVDAADCSQRSADVILVMKTRFESSVTPLTKLTVNDVDWFPNEFDGGKYLYRRKSVLTPFSVKLEVNKRNDAIFAWAVIQGLSSTSLEMTCRNAEDVDSIPDCTPNSTSPAMTPDPTTPKAVTNSVVTKLSAETTATRKTMTPTTMTTMTAASPAGGQGATTATVTLVVRPGDRGSGDFAVDGSIPSLTVALAKTAGIILAVAVGTLIVAGVPMGLVFLCQKSCSSKRTSQRRAAYRRGHDDVILTLSERLTDSKEQDSSDSKAATC